MFDRTIVTVWSAPNYCYRCGNVASILELDEHLTQEYKVFHCAPIVSGIFEDLFALARFLSSRVFHLHAFAIFAHRSSGHELTTNLRTSAPYPPNDHRRTISCDFVGSVV